MSEVITLPFISDDDEYNIRFELLIGSIVRAIEPFREEFTSDEINEAYEEAIVGLFYEEWLEGEDE